MKSSVSVIIPNKNKSAWLSACIQSCLVQGDWLKEIIIVDDHSEDNSLQIIEDQRMQSPELISVFINPGNGANDARNFGFDKSKGDFIQWLDSDDLLLEGKFTNQLPVLQSGTSDIAYSDQRFDFYDNSGFLKSEVRRHESYGDYLQELITDNWSSPNNYLMRRETASIIAKLKGWNPETPVGQDREYFTMAGIYGARFSYVPGIFSVYNKQSSGSVSAVDFKWRLEQNQILEGRLREEIQETTLISDQKKRIYLDILDTHLAKACFYHSGIRFSRFINPFRIRYDLMHWKMRLVMPWLILKKDIQFLL